MAKPKNQPLPSWTVATSFRVDREVRDKAKARIKRDKALLWKKRIKASLNGVVNEFLRKYSEDQNDV